MGVRELTESRTTDQTIDEVASGKKSTRKNADYFIGTTKMQVPRAKMEITPYIKDGMIEDWELFDKMVEYLYGECLHAQSQDHSVLFTEAAVSL